MVDRDRKRAGRRWWVRTALAAGGVGVAVAAFVSARQPGPSTPTTQTAPSTEAAATGSSASDSDYTTRPIAFIGRDTVITREELGEFLILRRGAGLLDQFVDRRIIDIACREAGIEVTAGEVEANLAEDLKGLGGITQGEFVKQVLRRYGKNLVEWKEDVVRPKLMMGKLCRTRIQVTEEDLHDAFEAQYGEKVECRIIQWLDTDLDAAIAAYPKIRDNEQEFSEQAKHQKISALASTGGKIKPFNRHLAIYNPAFKEKAVNDLIESEVFRLRPGEISNLLTVPGGRMAIKCDRRLPADTTINPAAVHDELLKEVTERKVLEEIPKVMKELRAKAQPESFPFVGKGTASEHAPFVPGASRGQVVAYIFNKVPVTREELGEYLITRYGAENLELLVNKHIIEVECEAKGITVDSADLTVALTEKVAATTGNQDAFDKLLKENHTTPYQFKEDVLRPQLLLTKLSAGRVKLSDEDLKAAYQAYYGEKIECRIILWPREERKYAMSEYAELRDSEQAFKEKASRQSNQALAASGGKLMATNGKDVLQIGRHTLGNEELERELFSLKPGEVSKLIETPQGIVVMKCDQRVPSDGSVPLEKVRANLVKEVTERRVQLEMPVVFAELRKKADPRLLLKDPKRPVDLTAEVTRDLDGGGPPRREKGAGKTPAGN
jgi:parvulin-like peptidyl-prolyl cis-trans isomerase-like protein